MSVQKISSSLLESTGITPAWDATALTGINTSSDFVTLKTNLALNFFLDAVDSSRSIQNLVDGFVDGFEDQLGVDDARSIEGLYDASGDYYSPDGREFTNLTSIMTSANTPSGTVSASSGTTPFYMFDHVLAGGGFYSDNPFNSPTYVQYAFNNGLYAQIITTYTITSDTDNPAARAPKNWTFKASNTGSFGGEEVTLNTQSNQSFGNYETKTYAFSNSTAYVYYRLIVTDIGNNTDLLRMFELELKGLGPVGNMTLVSEPSTALAAPDLAHVTLFKEDVDAITTNTDLLAWASRYNKTITATNASNVLNATAHGLSNGDRVIISTIYDDSTFTTPMSYFDGSNDYLSTTDANLGARFVNGKELTVAWWIDTDTLHDSAERYVVGMINGPHGGVLGNGDGQNKPKIFLRDTNQNTALTAQATNTITSSTGLAHVVMSVNSATSSVHIAINGVLETVDFLDSIVADAIFDFKSGAAAQGSDQNVFKIGMKGAVIGAQYAGNYDIGQLFYDHKYYDLTDAATLAKFYQDGAVDMGTDGTKTGLTQPIIYLNNAFGSFQNNGGEGGNFTESGTISDNGASFSSTPIPIPAGLSRSTVYHVVNKTANSFQVSLTASGSAVDITTDGFAPMTVNTITPVTLADESTYDVYDIVSGSADISGQPSGTNMNLIVQTKNTKDVKIHGQSLQWS